MKHTRNQTLIMALILLICLGPAVSAIAIGVSPSSLGFQVQTGGSEKKTFQVSTNSQTGLPFRLEVSESIGWLVRMEPSKGVADVKHAGKINISVVTPDGALPGNYTGFITVTAVPGGAESSGSSVSTGVALRINVEILGDAAAGAVQTAEPAENTVQKTVSSEPAPAEGDTEGAGNEITGNAAAAGESVSAMPLVLGTALVSIIIVVAWILIMMKASHGREPIGGHGQGSKMKKAKRAQK